MKFTGTLQLMRINIKDWKQVARQRMLKAVKEGAQLWINASIAAIPVWSGASHGTFKKLASLVNYQLSITPRVAPDQVDYALGIQVGFAQSNGKINKDFTNMIYTFTYKSNLWHLHYNEYKNANQNKKAGRVRGTLLRPGPYHFQELGRQAFDEYMKTVKLPNPWFNLTLTPKQLR